MVPAVWLPVVLRKNCFNDYFQLFDIQHGDVLAAGFNH